MNRSSQITDRRRFLSRTVDGLASIALASLLADESPAAELPPSDSEKGTTRRPHFQPKAKNVVVIFCSGAISQVDTFDYKPELVRWDGKPLPGNEKLVSFQGPNGNLTRPLWKFRPRGECGKMVSDLLPAIGSLADDLCFLHSLTNTSNTHGPAENVMNTGFAFDGFPSMGAWINFALGTENSDLPAFVAIEDPRGNPQSGPNNWASGFLPAAFQGTPFSSTKPIGYLNRPSGVSATADRAARQTLQFLERRHADRFPGDPQLEARIASYQLAARMQLSVPEAVDLASEPVHIQRLYGADSPNEHKASFARNCILARRLIERGVRFVQLFNGAYASGGRLNWDGHSDLKRQYDVHGEILDQPVAGLIRDLKQRGLLDQTLVVFATEFGRMPMFQQGTYGRDHNPQGFTCWLAGAGVRRGTSYGATDPFGFQATENVVTPPDFHATILHLLGLDHERLTFYHNGIERRLTNVEGHVIDDVLA
ncbi:DUF1501 domain-containing protein [Roseiconus nitratireducens]|uniref:DUF1501 domain-containing protein n=1 Tax=Roseiconus nitratireducens TaxID=2605748 RepID=A0A5M6D0A2_9BACT|nr:DUF1501 domain-containing protein [Roseiconus nitratireducens]KAA5538979.1 DUF1501 domain-containing protein [Roseiconus nitratireducens]